MTTIADQFTFSIHQRATIVKTRGKRTSMATAKEKEKKGEKMRATTGFSCEIVCFHSRRVLIIGITIDQIQPWIARAIFSAFSLSGKRLAASTRCYRTTQDCGIWVTALCFVSHIAFSFFFFFFFISSCR